MRRIVLLLTVAAMLAVMSAVSAAPASAMGCKGARAVVQHAPVDTPAHEEASERLLTCLFVEA
jgi:hypothetical protein